jgi:ROK family
MRTADVIADAARELMAHHEPAAIGLAAAGFVDADRSVVLFAPNLAWREEPLRDAMAQRLGLGGVSAGGDLLREPAVRSYRKHLTARGHRPTAEVRLAQLGPEAGIVRAAELARIR